MPTLSRPFDLTITPESFLSACSPGELQEVDLLIQSPRFRNKINRSEADIVIDDMGEQFGVIKNALYQSGR